MKDYLDDLLVWVIILVILTPVFIALAKRKQIAIFIVGFLLLLGSIPAAFMSELSINDCCGTSSTGRDGLGYLIGAVTAVAGILIMVFSKKFAKK